MIERIAREANHAAEVRRFRASLVIDTKNAQPFEKAHWGGRTLEFRSERTGPAISVAMQDVRCVMINLDPDATEANAAVMQTVIRINEKMKTTQALMRPLTGQECCGSVRS